MIHESFKAIKIAENIYWVGAIDWSLRDFHGYSTHEGSTYNAYLIMADKITLIDTVKAPFMDELLARIGSIVDPRKIKIIISNHAEMDHSGSLPEIIRTIKPEKVYASEMGVKALRAHFPGDEQIAQIVPVKDGEPIDLGNIKVVCYETRMLHWPDSMITYVPEKKLVFSQDAFGMHLASGKRFADEIPDDVLEYESRKYFANILLPYSALIEKFIRKITDLKLGFDIIAPDHGPVWRKNPEKIISRYAEWANQKPTRKIIITYDTMWKSTDIMARAISEGVISKGVEAKVMPLSGFHRSDVITELLCAGGLAAGSPTINNNLFPTVADLFYYIKGLKPKNLSGFAFGSYGWSGESITQVEEFLKEMNVAITSPGIKAKYVPAREILDECFMKGSELAERLIQTTAK